MQSALDDSGAPKGAWWLRVVVTDAVSSVFPGG